MAAFYLWETGRPEGFTQQPPHPKDRQPAIGTHLRVLRICLLRAARPRRKTAPVGGRAGPHGRRRSVLVASDLPRSGRVFKGPDPPPRSGPIQVGCPRPFAWARPRGEEGAHAEPCQDLKGFCGLWVPKGAAKVPSLSSRVEPLHATTKPSPIRAFGLENRIPWAPHVQCWWISREPWQRPGTSLLAQFK